MWYHMVPYGTIWYHMVPTVGRSDGRTVTYRILRGEKTENICLSERAPIFGAQRGVSKVNILKFGARGVCQITKHF